MNILFHCWEYPPQGSGIGRYIEEMSQALRIAGHFTVVVTSTCPGAPATQTVDNGVVLRLYDREAIGHDEIAQVVRAACDRYRVDVVEAVDHLGESAGFIRLTDRPPVLVKCHYNDVIRASRYAQACYAWQRVTINIACLRDRRRLQRERYSIEHADMLVAPSARMLDELKAEGLRLPSRAGVLPNPLAPVATAPGVEASAPTLLLVGRLDMGKGIEFLPALMRRVREAVPGTVLEIAGGDSYARFLGPTRAWLQRHLGDGTAAVRFLGQLTPAALDEAYRRAWVVIVPSRWDTFPTAVLEAMARGKAIVASPHGGMPEMLEGTSCPIADPAGPEFAMAVIRFLRDPDLRRAAGEGAVRRVGTRYAPATAVAEYMAFLNKALEKRS
jgi:glycogen(starch) synthase